jgi:hypothetical protein
VNELVVECPHCGEPSGVPPDPVAAAEIELLPELPPRTEGDNTEAVVVLTSGGSPFVDGIARVVGAGLDLFTNDDVAADEPIPRAIAREKPRDDTITKTIPTHPKFLK